jgi:ABC-type antimicrobial peptide transport system permease subunit
LLAYPEDTDIGSIIEWSEDETFIFRNMVDLYSKSQFLSELYKFTSILDGFSALVISVTLFVCLIFTSTIFMIFTKERMVEISVLRAIGFSPFKIFLLIIWSSMIYYFLGAILGMCTGLLLNRGLNIALDGFFDGLPSNFQPFRLNMGILILALVSTLVLSLLSGTVPAMISASRPPIRSLRGGL